MGELQEKMARSDARILARGEEKWNKLAKVEMPRTNLIVFILGLWVAGFGMILAPSLRSLWGPLCAITAGALTGLMLAGLRYGGVKRS